MINYILYGGLGFVGCGTFERGISRGSPRQVELFSPVNYYRPSDKSVMGGYNTKLEKQIDLLNVVSCSYCLARIKLNNDPKSYLDECSKLDTISVNS